MLSEKEIKTMVIHESCLLTDYERNDNYIGIQVQKAKIELLDIILEIISPKSKNRIIG